MIKQFRPEQTFMQANQLVTCLRANPKQWQEVRLSELGPLANKGELVVGGLEKLAGHGHVIIVYPGIAKPSGGYLYKNIKTGKMEKARIIGSYPPAMSTSMGRWPGAKNKGTKTVIDPWPNTFSKVRFWKYVGNQDVTTY